MTIGIAALLFAVALVATAPALSGATISGPADVIDGDGLKIGPVAIRLHGIDAPELGQRCAKAGGGTWACDEAAAERLEALVGTGEVVCDPLDRDGYGRVVARCHAGGDDVARVLASEGLAWAFFRFSDDYTTEEEAARRRERHLAGTDRGALGLPGGPVRARGRGLAAPRLPDQGKYQRRGRADLPHALVSLV